MEWWLWVIVGFVLLLGETLTPSTFFLFFFGVSALIVGAARAFGLESDLWYQVFLFTLTAVVLLGLARRPLLKRLQMPRPGAAGIDDMIGESAVAMETIAPGQVGRVELRGTIWSGRNGSALALAAGERCKVMEVVGLTVSVVPELSAKGAS
jgi:inner membrane protein